MKFYNFLSVPNPTSVIVTTDQPIPIRAGTEVTLICIVELSPALAELSSSLGVIVVWTGPSETLTGSDPPALIPLPPIQVCCYLPQLTLMETIPVRLKWSLHHHPLQTVEWKPTRLQLPHVSKLVF